MKKFKNGRIIIGKGNDMGIVFDTICVEVERTARGHTEKVLYPLYGIKNDYLLENIDIAVMSGLKREDVIKEIEKYVANKDNLSYNEEMRKKPTKEENNNDLIEIVINGLTNLDDLAALYYELEKGNQLSRYKNKILSKLKEINIENPFFYVNFEKYEDEWVDEKSPYSFNLYLIKIELLLQKYIDVKYDDMLDFDELKIRKKDYLEELLYNLMNQWQMCNALYCLYKEDHDKFFSVYSKFASAQYSTYAIAMLNFIYRNSIENDSIVIPKNIKDIILLYLKKVQIKMDEINIPSLSFEYSYTSSLENNSCIDYAKAFFQANSAEEREKLKILESRIKNSPFNIEECLLLQSCTIENSKSIRDLEVNIIALTVLLDNVYLKKSSNFKRLHLLFYQFLFSYLDLDTKSSRVLLKIKELYQNNFTKYDEEIKSEYQQSM